MQCCERIGWFYYWGQTLDGQEVVQDEVDLVGQATEVVAIEVESFVVVWAMVDKILEREDYMQQGKKISPAKAIVEAKATRALEYSTSDFEYKELENVIETYLYYVVSMVFEVPLHKVHWQLPGLLDMLL